MNRRARDRDRKHRLVAQTGAAVIVTAVLVGLFAWVIFDLRRIAQRDAEQSASNLVLSLEQDVARNIELYDLSLRNTVAISGLNGLADLSPEIRQAALFDSLNGAGDFGSTAVVDAAGAITYRSGKDAPRWANMSERDWFGYLRDHHDGGLHISLTPSSLLSGRQSMVLSRRIDLPDGEFGGAVAGVIFTDYFNRLFSGLDLGDGNIVSLVTTDGQLVARRPPAPAGSRVGYDRVELGRLAEMRSGSFERTSVVDGVRRIYSFRRVGDMPLIMQVGLSTKTVFAEWRQKAAVLVAVLAIFVTFTCLLAWNLRRELAQRTALEAHLRRREAGFRLLAEHAGDMVSHVGADGIRRYASPAAVRVMGWAPEALIGRSPLEIIHPDDRAAYQQAMGLLQSSGDVRVTYRVCRQDGSETNVETAMHALLNPDSGEHDGYVGVTRDVNEHLRRVTERLRQSEELREANSELQRLARHLSRARDGADRANRAKSRFLAGMSHELRTPLNGILGYTELLRSEGGLSPLQDERLHTMQDAGAHLLEMINRVLALSEIESGHAALQVSDLDLQDIAQTCLSLVRPGAEGKGLALELVVEKLAPLRIVTDGTRLRQIMLNLLGNAVKFTASGTIRLTLKLAGNGAGVRFEVADTGPGIAAEQRHRLFQDFERLDEKSGLEIEGAGLGLALSQRLTESMRGRIGYDDNPMGGSVFWVELPLQIVSESSAAAKPSVPRPARLLMPAALSILVADDSAINRDIARSFLQSAGHSVRCVPGGAEAVEAVLKGEFDVVLMDVRMPGIDGLEATRRIRALAGPQRDVPVLALTAQVFAEQVAACRDAGMNGHVAKPVTAAALLRAVAEICAVETGVDAAEADGLAEDAVAEPEVAGAMAAVASLGQVWNPDTFETTASYLNAAAIASFLQAIGEQGEALLQRLRQGAAGSALASLAEAAHALAGSAGMFGFERLTQAARCFEQAVECKAADALALSVTLAGSIEDALAEMRRHKVAG